MKTTTPTSNDVSSPSPSSSSDPRHLQATFTMDRVKTMFSCLSSVDAEPAAELCALYLSGTLSSDLFEDHPMGSGSSSSGSSSPLDPLATSNNNNSSSSVPVSPSGPRAGQKRSSVKRRKNCKLNHKVDGNRHRAENESEESMHFFPTVGPNDQTEKTEETPSPSKSSNGSGGSPQQQFDGTLATLSGHLLELQEEVDKVVTLSSAAVFPSSSSSSTSPPPSKSKTELENGRSKVLQQPEKQQQQQSSTDGSRNVRNSCSSNSSEHLNALLSEPLLALLQHLYRDLNKVKRYLTFKAASTTSTSSNAAGTRNRTRSRTKSTSSNKSSSSLKNGSPDSPLPVSSPTQYNSHVEQLLSNRGLLLQLLHLECTLLRFLDRMAEVTGGLHDCAGTVLASPQCSLLQSRLEDLLKAYYMLLTKLSYEPTFVRVVSLLHVSTPVNGARLLAILFRSLVLKEQNELKKKEKKMKKEDSVSSEDDPFKGAEEEEMELKVETTTTTANGRGERHHRATMRAMTSSTSTFNGNGCEMIANNRTLVLMLSFVEALAKEDLFACSASGKVQQQTTSLVVVCQGILAYFAGENEDDHERKNFSGKSLVRQRAIETLAHLCLTKNGLLDAIQRGGGPLLQTLLALISRCAHQHTRLVMRQAFLKVAKEEGEGKSKENSNASAATSPDSKQYIAVLRDIYGLLSTLISLTEFRSGREHLLFHEVGQRLFTTFMAPFVEMLNGTEAADPKHLIEAGKECPPLKEPGEAYRLLRQFLTGNQKMQRYLDRIIGISSIIIQRLLEPMPIPELEMEVSGGMNPFTFALPTEDLHQQQQQQNQQQQQPIQQDENARDGLPTAAAATPSASPLDLTLDDSKESHHFEAFDSDLDEDDHEEEEEDEDAEEEDGEDLDDEEDEGDDSEDEEEEDSFERVKGSGNANAIAAAESPDHFGRQLSATLGQKQQQQQQQQTKPSSTSAEQELFSADETNLLRPYLRFFPELQHFNVPAGSKNDEEDCRHLLDCSCTLGSSTTADQEEEEEIVRRLLARHQLQGSNSSNAGSGSVGPFARLVAPSLPPPPGAEPFDWASVYRRLAPSTASVMPRSPSSLPLPDLHFLQGSSGQRNETASPMSYPFLRRAPTLRKNYHHIKLVDHVRERLNGNGGRPLYQVIYDVQKEDNIMPQGRQIKFDSKFECGNLRKVLVRESLKKDEKKEKEEEEEEFLLLLNTDVNSATHTQWFYFSVSGMAAGRRYRFKIINLQKKSILYNSGQQPVLYSRRDFEQHRKMWQRVGDSTDDSSLVAYYRNHYVRGSSVGSLFADKPFYTLEFTYRARNDATDDDLVYFSYNVPYGYTFLRTTIAYWEHLVMANNRTEAREEDKVYFAHQTLCCSLKGNDLPLLTITGSGGGGESIKGRHYVLLSARVHPSESNSSWILKGFLDYLLHRSADPELEALRRKLLRNYVFKVLPMLNPDGVINGCTRTDLQTDDLNRQWQRPSPLLHPTIYHARNVLRALKHFSGLAGGHNPVAFVDLHGHSRRKNIFSYSCSPALSWKRADRSGHKRRVQAGHLCTACSPSSKGKGGGNSSSSCQLRGQMKVLKRRQAEMGSKNDETHSPGFYLLPPFATLPVLLQLAQAPAFSLDSCSFAVQRDREHTARVVGWRHFAIPLVYTVECTASGCDVGPYAGRHLTVDQLEEMGAYLAAAFAFLDFLHCGERHVPVIVLPKTTVTAAAGNNGNGAQQQTTTVISPVRHPGNDDFLRGLLEKCTRSRRGALLRRRAAPGADGTNRYQIRSLLQLYPDLNMLSASVLSTTTSSSSNSTTSLSSADSAAPKSPAKKKKAEEKEEEKET